MIAVTEADQVRIAEESARTLTRRWGGKYDWRELFGACWEGVRKAAGRGATHEHLLRHAAHMEAVTYVRWAGNGGWGAAKVLPMASVRVATRDDDGDGEYGALEPATFDRRNPDRRTLAIWCDHRHARANWPMRDRVMLYLYAVEGMTFKEVGAAVGAAASSVQNRLQRYCHSAQSIVGGSRTGDGHRTR